MSLIKNNQKFFKFIVKVCAIVTANKRNKGQNKATAFSFVFSGERKYYLKK